MAFTDFLNEGAIALSNSMKSFSEKTAEIVFSDLKKHVTYPFAKKKLNETIIHSGKIESKYGEFPITCKYMFNNDNTDAEIDGNIIYINISEELHSLIQDYYGRYNTKLKSKITNEYNELVKTINHELVHLVDPKLNKQKDKSFTLAKKNEDVIKELETRLEKGEDVEDKLKLAYEKYLKFPWEIDAYVSSEANSRMNQYFRKGLTKNMIQSLLSNVEPKTQIEKFYKTIPNIWKRYTKYLYKLLEEHFNKD